MSLIKVQLSMAIYNQSIRLRIRMSETKITPKQTALITIKMVTRVSQLPINPVIEHTRKRISAVTSLNILIIMPFLFSSLKYAFSSRMSFFLFSLIQQKILNVQLIPSKRNNKGVIILE